ncbi:hypothetical protein THRCLA_22739 [Thraustotheca clavata]|uniref:Uncharacterized protein n=1 Tax=Thraustotheca clavata TaxID=74557 RepID=A0A1V9YTJ8_9STRA|nr:hypothetical protein THRCLA_22739 [Thraustotheca clavata]
MHPPALVSYDEIMDFVNKSRPRALTVEERLDILRLHAYYRKQKMSNVAEHIAQILVRGINVVREVWTQYKPKQTVIAAPLPCNKTTH